MRNFYFQKKLPQIRRFGTAFDTNRAFEGWSQKFGKESGLPIQTIRKGIGPTTPKKLGRNRGYQTRNSGRNCANPKGTFCKIVTGSDQQIIRERTSMQQLLYTLLDTPARHPFRHASASWLDTKPASVPFKVLARARSAVAPESIPTRGVVVLFGCRTEPQKNKFNKGGFPSGGCPFVTNTKCTSTVAGLARRADG